MHYCIFDLRDGLLWALPFLAIAEAGIAGLTFVMDLVVIQVAVFLTCLYALGSMSSLVCWCSLLWKSDRTLYLWLTYQVLIIAACYCYGGYIFISGSLRLNLKASEEGYETLRTVVIGLFIYCAGPLELYTWRRLQQYQGIIKSQRIARVMKDQYIFVENI